MKNKIQKTQQEYCKQIAKLNDKVDALKSENRKMKSVLKLAQRELQNSSPSPREWMYKLLQKINKVL